MNDIELPTWQLILQAAERLEKSFGDFRLTQLIKEVQRIDPRRDWTSIQPVIQGMTAKAGKGPPSPCGKPLVRVSRGVYELEQSEIQIADRPSVPLQSANRMHDRISRTPRKSEVGDRISGVIDNFELCLEAYDGQVPFRRSGQYSWHRKTIDRRRSWSKISEALEDDLFLDALYETLQAWGIGKRASRIVTRDQFGRNLRQCSDEISYFEDLQIYDHNLDIPATSNELWKLIEKIHVVENVSLIVPGTKTLHHLLPDLVPPMDRAWTGAFFSWSATTPHYEKQAFTQTFASFSKIAIATQPSSYVGEGWRTSSSKILDNAIIGYCKLHGIKPRGN